MNEVMSEGRGKLASMPSGRFIMYTYLTVHVAVSMLRNTIGFSMSISSLVSLHVLQGVLRIGVQHLDHAGWLSL